MIAKEWRDARWKFLVAAVLVLVMTPNLTPYGELVKYTPGTGVPAARATYELFIFYGAGGYGALIPLAALLGVALISGEVSGGSIYLLLSRPMSRTRLLLTKYGVCAGVLLTAALLGGVALFVAAVVRGYPVESFRFSGVALSAVLLWLGSLFALGVALLASILFRSVIGSVAATALALGLVFTGPALGQLLLYALDYLGVISYPLQFRPPVAVKRSAEVLWPVLYWYSKSLYYGRGLVPTYFLISTVYAAMPLFVALWVFRRKAY